MYIYIQLDVHHHIELSPSLPAPCIFSAEAINRRIAVTALSAGRALLSLSPHLCFLQLILQVSAQAFPPVKAFLDFPARSGSSGKGSHKICALKSTKVILLLFTHSVNLWLFP
jgi:hypothetical protein